MAPPQFNIKRERRQAAAGVVGSLFSNGGNHMANNNNSSSNKTSTTSTRKSTAQPRPDHRIPPGGIGPIDNPNANDVLCGRGGRINSHAGNVQFRDIIQVKKSDYLAPTTKKLEKAHIAAGIVNEIRSMYPPGRFLKEEKESGMWYDIGDAKAIKKTGQALREDAPDIRSPGSFGDEKGKDHARRENTKTTNEQKQNRFMIWPQQQGNANNNNNMQQSTPDADYHAQTSMPPPLLPVNTSYDNNNNAILAQQPMSHPFQQQQNFMQNQSIQDQQGFQTRNIPLQATAQPKYDYNIRDPYTERLSGSGPPQREAEDDVSSFISGISNFSGISSFRSGSTFSRIGGASLRTNDSMAMSALRSIGSIKSASIGSIARSNSFSGMGSLEGLPKLDEMSQGSKNWARYSSAMSIDLQSNASSTQWNNAAARLIAPDHNLDEASIMSSGMMSTDLNALDLAF
mmetsp:Transcript_20518/g.44653  ORF Transcript_20518/g.44653 Transcript_20518/m.44653 type:complete len:456 (+) Transcript_20518:815-2182(+)|eukprot:CAMPEP_0168195096 /NCGR_PEP_ID=MMETSP0139_2-20121125/19641_1 /TAXON_ID=44445 /ORGANISM="Pseudo-nitzschia australis, Strain 10249 10 AB" /LENGTH=455 /DNA_ID=CAMNT_0008118863 /DNA_START=883 /DNA_END=2250 /DNA_ORIENTATION=+